MSDVERAFDRVATDLGELVGALNKDRFNAVLGLYLAASQIIYVLHDKGLTLSELHQLVDAAVGGKESIISHYEMADKEFSH
jgi:hypothetical protein